MSHFESLRIAIQYPRFNRFTFIFIPFCFHSIDLFTDFDLNLLDEFRYKFGCDDIGITKRRQFD